MRILLIILSFALTVSANSQARLMIGLTPAQTISSIQADTLRVNFSNTEKNYTGWNNIDGDPAIAVVNYTHSNGWQLSTIATTNWSPYTNGKCAQDNFTNAGNANNYFIGYSAALISNGWFNWFTTGNGAGYNVSKPHIKISGLIPFGNYRLRFTGTRGSQGFGANPMEYRVAGATSPAVQNVSGITGSGQQSAGADFTIQANANGEIYIWLNPLPGSSILAVIGALEVIQLVP